MYSQNREEEIILRAVDAAGIKEGTVFDIGAFDGKTNSNSLALIERGWHAYLIEPSPSPFLKLLKLHGDNPKVTLLNAAVGQETRIAKFYEFIDDQCGSLEVKSREKWNGSKEGDFTRQCREYWVAQVTPSTIIAQLGGSCDVLSIDTEGTAFDILTKCPIGSWTPAAICIEHDARAYEIAAWAEAHNYEVNGLNAENIVLVRRK